MQNTMGRRKDDSLMLPLYKHAQKNALGVKRFSIDSTNFLISWCDFIFFEANFY